MYLKYASTPSGAVLNSPGTGPVRSATLPTVMLVGVTPTSVAPPLPPATAWGWFPLVPGPVLPFVPGPVLPFVPGPVLPFVPGPVLPFVPGPALGPTSPGPDPPPPPTPLPIAALAACCRRVEGTRAPQAEVRSRT